jgi:hypothetical protein
MASMTSWRIAQHTASARYRGLYGQPASRIPSVCRRARPRGSCAQNRQQWLFRPMAVGRRLRPTVVEETFEPLPVPQGKAERRARWQITYVPCATPNAGDPAARDPVARYDFRLRHVPRHIQRAEAPLCRRPAPWRGEAFATSPCQFRWRGLLTSHFRRALFGARHADPSVGRAERVSSRSPEKRA